MKDFDDFNLILESIVSFIDEGVIIAEANGDVLYHNPSAYQLLGLPANIPITSINKLSTVNLKKSLLRAAIDAGHADAAGKPSDEFVRFTEQVLV
ncbi:MAG TPA: PAS domain-containing protein, partial [Thiotrichales bacterium]|nr:PAS domain-containing protein [Thiotrichales bacterium]